MDPLLKASLQAPAYRLFGAVKIVLANGDTVRLLTEPATLTIGGETYTGSDPAYGSLGGLDALTDGQDGQAPLIRLTLEPITLEAVDGLIDPANQGALVSIMLGTVNSATGQVIGFDTVFLGEVDVPTYSPDANSRTVEIDAVSVFERFFDRDEGARLSNAFWTSVFPGDTALEDMTSLIKKVFWGMATIGPSGPSYVGDGTVAGWLMGYTLNRFGRQ